MSYVIAVGGPPGSGKTSLLAALARRLGDAPRIFFDHYQRITEQPLNVLLDWMDRGADVNEFVIQGLAEDLARLKAGNPIRDPVTNTEVRPAKYILFEAPFGRSHKATGQHIDMLIWIDVPLDIALARKMKELTEFHLGRQPPEQHTQCLRWFGGYLDSYLRGVRKMLLIQRHRIGGEADVAIDGSRDLQSVTQHALSEILKRAS